MGRRSLPKLDPQIDLSHFLYSLEQLPEPWDAEEFFGRCGDLEIEVGSGKGLFMATAAESHPDRNFLGIEIARKYAAHAAAKLARRNLTNAKMVQGDANSLFATRLPAACLAAVHVYFPDPWWKKRHHKRRIMNELFLEHVVRLLRPGGMLHFWTDVQEYFQASLEMIAEKIPLEGPLSVPERIAAHELDYRTHFERRMRLHQHAVYRSQFRKP